MAGDEDDAGNKIIKTPITGEQSSSTVKPTATEDANLQVNFNIPFEKLVGDENWSDWKLLMELYLGDLYKCTLKDPPAEVLADRDCKAFKEDLIARQKISFGVDKNVLKYLRGATTAHQAWTKLCNSFEDRGVFRRAHLLRKLVSLKQETSLSQYVLDFKEVVGQIADTGKEIEDEMCSVLLLANVKPVHKPFCQIVERTCQTKLDGATTLEFKIISEELLREGNKIKTQEDAQGPSQNQNPNKTAMKMSAGWPQGKSRPGHRSGGGSSKTPPSGRSRNQNQNRDRRDRSPKSKQPRTNGQEGKYPQCIHCKKTNHPASSCHFRQVSAASQSNARRDRKRRHSGSDDEAGPSSKQSKKEGSNGGPPKWVLKIAKKGKAKTAASSSQSTPGNDCLVDEIDDIVNTEFCDSKVTNKTIKMYLDSGAFAPMSPEITCLHNYKPIHNEPIECAGDQVLYTQGVGTLKLNTNIEGLLEIQNMTYVPGLTCTLLSISAITKNNLIVVFKDKICGIYKPDSVRLLSAPVIETVETNGTYSLDVDVKINNQALRVARQSQAELWHKRFAHLLAHSEKFSARTKHFGVRIQLVRDCIEDGSIALEHMASKLMPADLLTKSLGKHDHQRFSYSQLLCHMTSSANSACLPANCDTNKLHFRSRR
ncbi:Retrovirus-related Pol polyprotein from transposon TNT 1-94 [Frankliniella fusca]|uniref:Retrovirus-related Pol polyprotein from transposon TNT 1-94 n=1 Tax=Frankliniella fusca TaxID=407009 RepID=A0AAE1H1W5_9NEOP|nr:Retrovirus-related Pol polyprotein from transposon TNT 1-94 [Frankliniella fusca]KAK3913437.1 Retrovirus-related Pol polyprotein from transposon TNT 1-94 [Frankliniella fusca]